MSEELKEEVLEEIQEEQEEKLQEDTQEVAEGKISILEEKLKEEQEKYLRVHADFENIKKRLEREKYMAIDYASEKFAKDLLMPIDTLEMALAAEKAADLSAEELLAKLKEGVELTIKNFYSAFEKHNISVVDTDCDFNPNLHNAVMQVDSEEHKSGQIVQVMQKGYILKDRLLRTAMVSIAN